MSLEEAYSLCERLARRHYENFHVGSRLLPKAMRRHLWAIYAFCRLTDDLGDEASGDRLAQLLSWEEELRRCYGGAPSHPAFIALKETIEKFSIPQEPFKKLIRANRMDQSIKRYPTFRDLLNYCDHSANPVGHLLLYIFGHRDEERQKLSDYTCTALQLTNFWQDITLDLKRDRIYIPLEDLRAFRYTEDDLKRGVVDGRFRALMRFEIERTRNLFHQGIDLVKTLEGPLKMEVKLFSLGGLKILEAIESQGYDVFRSRPTLSSFQKAKLFLKVLLGRDHARHLPSPLG